jgi:hypothetical protein
VKQTFTASVCLSKETVRQRQGRAAVAISSGARVQWACLCARWSARAASVACPLAWRICIYLCLNMYNANI